MQLSGIGKIVRHHRNRLGITQQELAQRAGLSVKFLERLENERGSINPTVMTLLALSTALSIRLADLIPHQPVQKEGTHRRLRKPNRKLIELATEELTPEQASALVRVAELLTR